MSTSDKFVYILTFTSMLVTREISKSGDPSENIQTFRRINLNILCSRYWWLEIWKGKKMSFPYWRLYWNKNEGAYVYYDEKRTFLKPDHIYLIPPHTPFSNGIVHQKLSEESDYFFKCGRINSRQEEKRHHERGDILHFFTHFTLGFPYDDVRPGVYNVALSKETRKHLKTIRASLIKGSRNFSLKESLNIYSLILSSIDSLPDAIWQLKKVDRRIMDILKYMEENTDAKMTNETLAAQLFLTPSVFSRLFKRNIGKSPSKYLTHMRIDKASNLLLHSNSSIETIAMQCGFTDRYHLTKVFSKLKGTAPAAFRKRYY